MPIGHHLRRHPLAVAFIVAMTSFAAVIALAMAGYLPQIYQRTTGPSDWALTYPPEPDDRVLSVEAIVGDTCNSFAGFVVTESPARVEVVANVHTTYVLSGYCGAILKVERATVALDDPIGDRQLVGCNHGGGSYYSRFFDAETDSVDCRVVPPHM